MGNLLLYIVAVLLSIYLNIMFEFPVGNALIGAEAVFLCICLGQAYYLHRKVIVKMSSQVPVIQSGEEGEIQVLVRNRCLWSVTDVELDFTFMQHGKKDGRGKRVSLQIPGGEERRVSVCLKGERCGKVKVLLKKQRVYDCFRMIGIAKKRGQEAEVLVLPRIHSVNLRISEETRAFPMDGEEYSKHQSGDDPSEVFDVRAYREGDRIQNIHWKLSARKEELYVKEYSRPIGASVLLVLEGGDSFQNEADAAAYVEMAVSLSHAMLLAECPHYVAFMPQGEHLERVHVRNMETFQELVRSLLLLLEQKPKNEVYTAYQEIYTDAGLSTVILWNQELVLRVKEETICGFKAESLREELQKMELVI